MDVWEYLAEENLASHSALFHHDLLTVPLSE